MNQQVVINNLLMDFNHIGQGKKALLFLHGWQSNKEVWGQVIKELSGYEIYAIDLPGFGKSPAPKSAWAVGDYADLVAEFIKKLDLKNIIVVGHSFGGRVGIKLSSQHPELIEKLVLVDSAGFAMDGNKKSAMNLVAKIVKPLSLVTVVANANLLKAW